MNLAGVRRLLSIAEIVARMRPLVREGALTRQDARRRLALEIERLTSALGL